MVRVFSFTKKLGVTYIKWNVKILLLSLWRFNSASCSRLVSQRCRERAEESGKYWFIYGNGAGAEETDVHSVYQHSATHGRLLWVKGNFTTIEQPFTLKETRNCLGFL